jgi:hypothetical protein
VFPQSVKELIFDQEYRITRLGVHSRVCRLTATAEKLIYVRWQSTDFTDGRKCRERIEAKALEECKFPSTLLIQNDDVQDRADKMELLSV